MTRPLRRNVGGAIYYISLQGDNYNKFFIDKKDYLKYLALLTKYKGRYGYKLYAFLLIPDQIQLVVKTPFPNLSKIMHSIDTTYTMYFNKRHNRKGHLFRERYKSLIVNMKAHLLDITKYIHLCPLMSGLSESLEGYPWSSYSFIAEGYGPGLIDREGILNLLDGDVDSQVESYKRFLEEGLSKIEMTTTKGYNVIVEEFIDSIKDVIDPRFVTEEKQPPSINQIVDIIADYYQIEDRDVFLGARSRKNPAIRQMAIYISRTRGDKKLNELAKYFGGITAQAVSKSLSSFENRLRYQQDLKRDMNIICGKISKVQ